MRAHWLQHVPYEGLGHLGPLLTARDAAVLGICLGAQLIASALGAPVGPNPEPELGWWPIRRTAPPDPASTDLFDFPEELTCLNWHGETFGLPGGAVHLARSAACEHQAMQIGRRVIGLQFHPEATPDWVEAVLRHGGRSLPYGPYVMPPNELISLMDHRCRPGKQLLAHLIEFLMPN